jgi:hypothetical protein
MLRDRLGMTPVLKPGVAGREARAGHGSPGAL